MDMPLPRCILFSPAKRRFGIDMSEYYRAVGNGQVLNHIKRLDLDTFSLTLEGPLAYAAEVADGSYEFRSFSTSPSGIVSKRPGISWHAKEACWRLQYRLNYSGTWKMSRSSPKYSKYSDNLDGRAIAERTTLAALERSQTILWLAGTAALPRQQGTNSSGVPGIHAKGERWRVRFELNNILYDSKRSFATIQQAVEAKEKLLPEGSGKPKARKRVRDDPADAQADAANSAGAISSEQSAVTVPKRHCFRGSRGSARGARGRGRIGRG
eukprot:TRINITY_DN3721_c0_g1_i2.p1 TRINITY_DN3721_c0_g1~~TRINITY_DN3721_c0_g1_i2.p1  ORF type:complete len:268 (+),score=36.13 TRINITY_DN3721_c0_g1_i2:344-1147(+)